MASRRPIGLCATLAAICAAGPLAAQQADPPPAVVATPLDAVTAVGTRTPTVSGDSAVPVSVLSRERAGAAAMAAGQPSVRSLRHVLAV